MGNHTLYLNGSRSHCMRHFRSSLQHGLSKIVARRVNYREAISAGAFVRPVHFSL